MIDSEAYTYNRIYVILGILMSLIYQTLFILK